MPKGSEVRIKKSVPSFAAGVLVSGGLVQPELWRGPAHSLFILKNCSNILVFLLGGDYSQLRLIFKGGLDD